jgi:hypothetical protein
MFPLNPAFAPDFPAKSLSIQILVAEHETSPGFRCKWNFVPQDGNHRRSPVIDASPKPLLLSANDNKKTGQES